MAASADKSQAFIPRNNTLKPDGWSTEDEATATCFCGPVQLAFPTHSLGFVDAFVCNCTDCRKLTTSMFASNFTIDDAYLKHLRGQNHLKTFGQSATIASGNKMTNYFCSTCGTLMYRVSSGSPGKSILRIGTIDDFNLHETKVKPSIEQFIGTRVAWRKGVEGAKEFEGDHFAA